TSSFGKVQLYFPTRTPKLRWRRQIKPYKTYTLQRAYKGESYFWGLLPQQGDLLQFTFDPPVVIKGESCEEMLEDIVTVDIVKRKTQVKIRLELNHGMRNEVLFRSGNVEHPSDRLYNTTVEVLPVQPFSNIPAVAAKKYKITEDKYMIVGDFDDMGVAEG
ncbi:alpha-1,3-mannosyl-glycoprotein 4-beta-N-acetylglucosaminyltransferase B-like, partial [Penaeus vannamei]